LLYLKISKKLDTRKKQILLDTDLKIYNFVGTLKIISNAVKNFDILATSLKILYNEFNSPNKIIFRSISS